MSSFSIRHPLRSLGIAAILVGLALCTVGEARAQNGYLLDTFNSFAVVNGPQHPTITTLSQPALITTFATYHWNNGQGAIPGTIKFTPLSANGTSTGVPYGPYGMGTQSGQTGVADVAWVGSMGGAGLLLPAGSYRIDDSDPSTWSTNAQSGYQGFVRLTGSYTTAPQSQPASQPATVAQPAFTPQPQPQIPVQPLSVSLSPMTFNTLVVNGQIQYTFSFSWSASGGAGGLNVTIQVEDPSYYGPSPLPGLRNMPYPARTSGVWNPTQIPTPGMMFRAMVTDSTGAVAYSPEQPIP